MKSLTINELIKTLIDLKAQMGNRQVLLSIDSEGNAFHALDPNYSWGDGGKKYLVIYPSDEFVEI